MKLIAPDYYPDFHCIADKCRHSCCIGWEIDIDPATRKKYRHVPGDFGARLNASIEDGKVSSFRLDADERCPMLNQSGLCDLITELGEENLCQICADHPRFRNHYLFQTEIGLGLCCEEAARLILTQDKPMQLIELEDDGYDIRPDISETDLLNTREILIACMQDNSRPLEQRLDILLDTVEFTIAERDWVHIFRCLERLDPAWDNCLDTLDLSRTAPPHLHQALGNFAAYMLYRHVAGDLEYDDIPGWVAFCVLSTQVVAALCAAKPDCTIEDCIEFARMYSAEIEYSEDNVAALLYAL